MGRYPSNRWPTTYLIKVKGCLNEDWSGWFDGLVISHGIDADGGAVTTLVGSLADQSALQGILGRLHTLNLELIAVLLLDEGTPSLHGTPWV